MKSSVNRHCIPHSRASVEYWETEARLISEACPPPANLTPETESRILMAVMSSHPRCNTTSARVRVPLRLPAWFAAAAAMLLVSHTRSNVERNATQTSNQPVSIASRAEASPNQAASEVDANGNVEVHPVLNLRLKPSYHFARTAFPGSVHSLERSALCSPPSLHVFVFDTRCGGFTEAAAPEYVHHNEPDALDESDDSSLLMTIALPDDTGSEVEICTGTDSPDMATVQLPVRNDAPFFYCSEIGTRGSVEIFVGSALNSVSEQSTCTVSHTWHVDAQALHTFDKVCFSGG